jgi:CRISPR-associated protein Cas2
MYKLYIASYDIADNKRLRRVLNTVKDYSTGGQYSCFECFLKPQQHSTLLYRVAQIIDPDDDHFFLVRVTHAAKTLVLGAAEKPNDLDYLMVM